MTIVFGIKRFHQYLVGRHLTICSDYKHLQHLFGQTWGIPTLASAHFQRWALTLERTTTQSSTNHGNANVLSHFPLPALCNYPWGEPSCHQHASISTRGRNDSPSSPQNTTVLQAEFCVSLLTGLQAFPLVSFQPFCNSNHTMERTGSRSLHFRISLHVTGRDSILAQFHEGQSGIKSLARSIVWWPGLDKALEGKVKCCEQYTRALNICLLWPPYFPWNGLIVPGHVCMWTMLVP